MAKVEQVEDNKKENALRQIKEEHKSAKEFLEPKIEEWRMRLRIYNNQRKDKTAIGDPLMFTVFQTILATLYSDTLITSWSATEEGDSKQEEALNVLSKHDHKIMEKDVIDYDWIWNTLFFGRGLISLMQFDKKTNTPIPEVIDMFSFLRDPAASSVNGTGKKSIGAARYFGRELRLTKDEMKQQGVFINLEALVPHSHNNELKTIASQARSDAQGTNSNTDNDNSVHSLIEWFTHVNGDKVIVVTDTTFKHIFRFQKLKDQTKWPIIDRTIFPVPGDWDGVSVADLLEDKQRARAKLQNLALQSAEAGLYPTYFYDQNKVNNKAALNYDKDTFVPVDGSPGNVMQEAPRSTVKSEVDWMMNILDTAAQRATATPAARQGQLSGREVTATEVNRVSSGADTRFSLSAKIFGMSEKRFWRQWYDLYKLHFLDGIDEKVARIAGFSGPKWRTFTKKDIIMGIDPDVTVESMAISEADRINKLQAYTNLGQLVLADDQANRRFYSKKLAKLTGLDSDEINHLYPKTIEEMNVDKENDMLNNGKLPPISMTDDDRLHILGHDKANDNSKTRNHMEAHKLQLRIKKEKPSLVPVQSQDPFQQGISQTATPATLQDQTNPITQSIPNAA